MGNDVSNIFCAKPRLLVDNSLNSIMSEFVGKEADIHCILRCKNVVARNVYLGVIE